MAGQVNDPHPSDRKAHGEGLHSAARAGDLEAVRAICLSNPLSINTRDKHSRTPLHLAAWSGQTEVAQFLCEQNVNVGAAAVDDMAAIHFASQKGHLQIVRILLTSGASVDACTRKGMTALHYAAQGGHMELAKLLIRKGASLNAKTKAGKRPIDVAKNDEVRSILTTCGASIKNRKEMQRNRLPEVAEAGVMHGIDDLDDKLREMPMEKKGMPHMTEEDVKMGERPRENEQTAGEIGPQPKKAKVALSHLVDDDTQEDDS